MANCKKFQELLPLEKSDYIGRLVHAVSNDDNLFKYGKKLIELAEIQGLFDGVKINPPKEKEPEFDEIIPSQLN